MAKDELNVAEEASVGSEVEVRATRKRIPMSVPRQKLACAKIPGFHCHWMADRPGRIPQALQAGYEFVDIGEISVQNTGLADDISLDGNNDLGSRVSVIGGVGQAGDVELLYLMKLKQEWWDEDQAELRQKNNSIWEQIHRGEATMDTPGDASNRYVKNTSRVGFNSNPEN